MTTLCIGQVSRQLRCCSRSAFSKPAVWMRLHPDEGSRRAAHTDVVSSHRDISTHDHSWFQELKQLQDCLFYILHDSTHTHIHARPHILNYLSSACTHTPTLKVPHKTCDCSSTVLYSYERVSVLSISLSISLI